MKRFNKQGLQPSQASAACLEAAPWQPRGGVDGTALSSLLGSLTTSLDQPDPGAAQAQLPRIPEWCRASQQDRGHSEAALGQGLQMTFQKDFDQWLTSTGKALWSAPRASGPKDGHQEEANTMGPSL